MPSTEVKLDNGNKSFDGIFYVGNVKEHLGMTHEAAEVGQQGTRLVWQGSSLVATPKCGAHTWLFFQACFEVRV
jgi:hypothetical protein